MPFSAILSTIKTGRLGPNRVSVRGKLNSLNNTLKPTVGLIDRALITEAIRWPGEAFKKVDGYPKPLELAAKSEAFTFAEIIQYLLYNLRAL